MVPKRSKCRIGKVYADEEDAVWALVGFQDGRQEVFPVTFSPLLEWRLEKSDEVISSALSAFECSVWIEDGTIVEIETNKQVNRAREETSANGPTSDQAVPFGGPDQVAGQARSGTREVGDGQGAPARTEEGDMPRREHTKSGPPSDDGAPMPISSEQLWGALLQAEKIALARARSEKSARDLKDDLDHDERLAAKWAEYNAWIEISEAQYPRGVVDVARQRVNELAESIDKRYPGALDKRNVEPHYPESISLQWRERPIEGAVELLLPIPVSAWESIRLGGTGVEETLAMRFIWSLSKWQQDIEGESSFSARVDCTYMKIECASERMNEAPEPYLKTEYTGDGIKIRLIAERAERRD